MDKVWLSTTYFDDPAVEELSRDAEVMMIRGIAHCGRAETGGYLSVAAVKKLGIPNPLTLARELAAQRILVERETGGWDYRTWDTWQADSLSLIERKKADRARQAKRRAAQRMSRDTQDMSRDMSRDNPAVEKRREEKNSSLRDKASHESNANDDEPPPRGPKVDPTGWRLVRELIPLDHPQAVRTELANRAGALLLGGTPETDVREALSLWLTKPNLGPKTLDSLVSEIVKTRDHQHRSATNGAATSKAAGWLAVGEQLEPTTARKAIDR